MKTILAKLALIITAVITFAACATTPSATPLVPVSSTASLLQMSERRASHSATLLLDGRVLVAGGFVDDGQGDETALASAELFDPNTNAFLPLPKLNEARNSHTATRLPNGHVLLVGGWGTAARLSSAEVFQTDTGVFMPLESLAVPRAGHTATLLNDGRVLIVGGSQARHRLVPDNVYYEPATQQFVLGPSLIEPREGQTATLLNDGRVLVVGGTDADGRVLASAEIYDPKPGLFAATGSLHQPRYKHAATLLADGRVFIVGGSDERDWGGQYLSIEIYDPATGTFSVGPNLNGARFKLADAVALMEDGRVFIGGGNRQLEIFDLTAQTSTARDVFQAAYYFSTATSLNDGRVLVAGGYTRNIVTTAQAWLLR